MRCIASSSVISVNSASSASSTRSGSELVAGAKRAGATTASRARFTPMLSVKNHRRRALGCVAGCSAIGCGAAPGAVTSALCCCCRSARSNANGGTMLDPLAALDGGPGGSEGSRDFDEADEPPAAWVCPFCIWWEIISRSMLARSREMRRLARSLMRR